MNNIYKKGLTIIEVAVILAIVGILISIALPQFSKLRENQLLKSATNDVLSALSKVRSKTLASVNSSEYGVHFQADQVIIFKGKVFVLGAPDNEIILIQNPVRISNVTLGGVSGPSGDMYFNRLYNVPSAAGTITISSSSVSKIITISATGNISLN